MRKRYSTVLWILLGMCVGIGMCAVRPWVWNHYCLFRLYGDDADARYEAADALVSSESGRQLILELVREAESGEQLPRRVLLALISAYSGSGPYPPIHVLTALGDSEGEQVASDAAIGLSVHIERLENEVRGGRAWIECQSPKVRSVFEQRMKEAAAQGQKVRK